MYQTAKNKAQLFIYIILFSLYSPLLHAAFNPYNKKTVLNFGDNVHWVSDKNEISKSGQKKVRNNINYYHLRINADRLLLRLGQNDPKGNIENSRSLNALDILDVKVDDQRLPMFQWCMTNRMGQIDKKAFRQGTVVTDNICINANGDFVIKLDKETRQFLAQGKSLQFRLMPYDSVETISFSLNGLEGLMVKMNQPPKVTESDKKDPVAKAPKPPVVVKPAVSKKPPVKKVARTCYSKPPSAYKKKINVISFPCGNNVKKADAEKRIQQQLMAEKQKEKNALKQQERLKAEEARKKAQTEIAHRSEKWESEQDHVWIARCKVRWARGVSPCFCRRVFDQAPPSTVDTCKK